MKILEVVTIVLVLVIWGTAVARGQRAGVRETALVSQVVALFAEEEQAASADANPIVVSLTSNSRDNRFVRGQLVRIRASEKGDVRERAFKITPEIEADNIIEAADGKGICFCSPADGRYTVSVIAIGTVRGYAMQDLVIEIYDRDAPLAAAAAPPPVAAAAASGAGSYGQQNAMLLVRQALASVNSTSKADETRYVAGCFKASNSLSEAKAAAMKMGAARMASWQPFFAEIEKLLDSMEADGRMNTAAARRGAMEQISSVLSGESEL